MSIHTDRAYRKAKSLGASAARDYATWKQVVSLSKRELAEVAMHLAALCTDGYDDALSNGEALSRLLEERDMLKTNGII